MAKQTLSDAGLKAIGNNIDLFADVAKELHVTPINLVRAIYRKSPQFSQYNIIKLISERTGLKPDKLLKSA